MNRTDSAAAYADAAAGCGEGEDGVVPKVTEGVPEGVTGSLVYGEGTRCPAKGVELPVPVHLRFRTGYDLHGRVGVVGDAGAR